MTEEISLRFRGEGLSEVSKASALLRDYKSQLDASWKSSLQAAQGAKITARELADLSNTNVPKLADDFKRFDDRLSESRELAKGLREELEGLQVPEVARASNPRLGASLSTGASLVSGIAGNGGGAEVLRAGAHFVQIGTQVKASLDETGQGFKGLLGNSTALVGGLSAVALVIGVLQNESKKFKEQADAEIAGRENALRLIAKNNQDEIQLRINSLSESKKINAQLAEDAKRNFETFREEAAKNLNPVEFAQFTAQIATGIGEAGQQYKALEEASSAAQAQLGNVDTELGLLEQSSGKTAQSLDEIVAAAKRVQDVASDITNHATADLEAYQLVNNGTQKQLDERLRSLQIEAEVTKNSAAIAQYRAEQLGLETEEGKAAKAEADKLSERSKAASVSIDVLSQSFVRAAVTARDLAAENEKIRQDQIALTKAYDNATIKNTEDRDKALLDNQTKLNENLVSLGAKAAEAAAGLLQHLEEKRADLATSFGEGEIDAQRKADYERLDSAIALQRDLTKNAKKHADDLVKIQEEQTEKERSAVLNRDFAQLYELQRTKTKEINASNKAFDQQQADRIEAYNEAEIDQIEHLKRDEETRKIGFDRQYAAVQLSYNRDIAQQEKNARDAFSKAITAAATTQALLGQKYANEQTLLNQSITAGLKLAAEGAAGKLRLEADYWEQSKRLIKGDYGTGSTAPKGGAGGTGAAGFGIGMYGTSSALDIPRAASTSQSSSVSNVSSKNSSLTLVQNITGGQDSARIAAIAAEQARKVFMEVVS